MVGLNLVPTILFLIVTKSPLPVDLSVCFMFFPSLAIVSRSRTTLYQVHFIDLVFFDDFECFQNILFFSLTTNYNSL